MSAHADAWWDELRWPLLAFAVAIAIISATGADTRIAGTIFFDEARMRWRGGESWWANDFLHTGGRWFIRSLVASACCLWITTFFVDRWRQRRRPVAYFIVSMVLAIGCVGLLKQLTNVDCPWDLQLFGGRLPYVSLFSDRLESLRAAHCFPAAHASSGYALMTLYFAIRERSRAWATVGLAAGVAAGLVFGLAQQSRGAHFLSHDVWSSMLVWLIASSVYRFGFRSRLWSRPNSIEPGV
ncbi:membrane-associated PAP2 superfamily phosphatase [Povalibacter uvarum]|uniref:Membrane-associated PAP2 superfamily phosphatase n=1 Tax=Povalibacter uvarum TaxID=732238 RepID=A0A841HPJ0_9GAMM|nr:phosphatase PAP2 family protein [Povalibacter uvarum]MBB6094554.1 membrane-associated PAP2 superfamily phosphatase [Povalibacter uvarum]